MKKLTNDDIIKRCKELYGDKYDYSKVEYVKNDVEIVVTCKKHGDFKILPKHLLNGHGCQKCSYEKVGKINSTSDEEKLQKLHTKYNNLYTLTNPKNIVYNQQTEIICKYHGVFKRSLDKLMQGQICPECSFTFNLFKEAMNFYRLARNKYGYKYDYSKVDYVNSKTKVCIICPIHGEFWQTPDGHLSGVFGCTYCGGSAKKTLEEFINEARQIHGDKYDYSKVEYTSIDNDVIIICKEHGEFKQTPHNHLNGKGCPLCKEYFLEKTIRQKLEDKNINYIFRYKKILPNNLEFDFYLPKYNTAIECQGIQHFEPVEHFGGIERFNKQVKNDYLKQKFCKENNIRLFYFSNLHIDYPYKVYENIEELLYDILI